jgi:hypothetical protein
MDLGSAALETRGAAMTSYFDHGSDEASERVVRPGDYVEIDISLVRKGEVMVKEHTTDDSIRYFLGEYQRVLRELE